MLATQTVAKQQQFVSSDMRIRRTSAATAAAAAAASRTVEQNTASRIT